MAGTKLTNKEDKTRINISFPSSLMEELRALAEKENRSINNLVITILKNYVEGRKK